MLMLLIFLLRVNTTFRERKGERQREISDLIDAISIVADIGHRSSFPIQKIILLKKEFRKEKVRVDFSEYG